MPLAVGCDVLVIALRRKGRIVQAAAGGRYRVMVGNVSMWCREGEIEADRGGGKKPGRAQRPQPVSVEPDVATAAPGLPAARSLATIDLHGLTVDEALQAVEVRLDQAIRAGLDRLEIIHGISGGRLRAAVRRYLADVPSVVRFGEDPRNAGVTLVFF
jgi:dsDNA-specific endonuclease/ATPase MutS2